MDDDTLEAFWRAADDEGTAPPPGPPWVDALVGAARAELRFDLDAARRLLAEADVPRDPRWQRARELVRLRVVVRQAREEALQEALPAVRELVAPPGLREAETPTWARAQQLLGAGLTRLGHLAEAQRALVAALTATDEVVLRVRLLDGLATTWYGEGAWEEARRTFRAVAGAKEALGDAVGVAISMGSLARMEIEQGHYAVAHRAAAETLERHGAALPGLTRIRLATAALEAAVGMKDADLATRERARLGALLQTADRPASHFLLGYANLALARSETAPPARAARFAEVRRHFSLNAQRALVLTAEARATPRPERDPAWFAKVEALLSVKEAVVDVEVDALLLRAEERFEDGDAPGGRALLARAAERVARSNNYRAIERVDDVAARLDPTNAAERLARRFTGRGLEAMRVTRQIDASVIFVDLVDYTARSVELAPEEVMATVRSLFQLCTPTLVRHQVRPTSYLGDGLLAVAEGAGHERRATAFALDLLERVQVANEVRRTLRRIGPADRRGDWGLELRGGVCSGTVVAGALGSALKLELAIIGLTTNLAARLQGKADKGEVVISRRVAERAFPDGACPEPEAAAPFLTALRGEDRAPWIEARCERLALKGLSEPLAAVRLRPVAVG